MIADDSASPELIWSSDLKYASAVIVAVVLGSAFGVGLPPPAMGARTIARPTKQIVFVNRDELARLHPGWQALNDMRSTLDGTVVSRSPISVDPSPNRAAGTASRGGSVGRSRSELVAKAARDASAALDGLESRKYEALRARREAMKSQLLKNSESDWKSEARNIEEAAAVETKLVDDRNASDLVNARLRASASEVASRVSRKEGSGMDKAAADEHLQAATAELADVGRADDAEKARIVDAANAKIKALKQASEKRVEEQLSLYQAEQAKLIADSMASARSDIAQELGPVSTPGLFAAGQGGSVLSGAGLAEYKVDRLVDLKAAASALQVRIDKDVSSMVLGLAAEKGLKVTFERQKGETRDATRMFAELIRKHGWSAGTPAMCGSGSS